MKREAAAPSHLVAPLVRWARAKGAALDLKALGLPDAPQEDTPVTGRELGALFDAVAEALDAPHLGLELPGALPYSRYELPDLAARSSPTLREGLQRLTRYAPLLNDALQMSLSEERELAHFIHRVKGNPRGVSRHLNEFSMAMGVYGCRTRTGLSMPVREVRFMNWRPSGSLETLQRYFGTKALSFGHAENTLTFEARVLDATQQTADALLLKTAEGLADDALKRRSTLSDGFAAAVERAVRENLERGDSVRQVALKLRMSTRTLQRRLGDEGTTYAQVLDRVRESLARERVASDATSLSEVAFSLGFAEFATFSRAFKRWTGSAPGAFRGSARSG